MSLPTTGLIYCCSECGCIDISALHPVHLNRFHQLFARRTTERLAKNNLGLDITLTLTELEDIVYSDGDESDNHGACWCPECEENGPICHIDLQTKQCHHCKQPKRVVQDGNGRPKWVPISDEPVYHPELKLHEYIDPEDR